MNKPLPALHRSLHLQHYRHTGRRLHHKHTSYRGLAVVVVLAGIVILSLNILARATADDLVVYARNPAPIPTTPATITSPRNNMVITSARVVVSGTCPQMTPSVITVITDNGAIGGSTPCTVNSTYSIPLILSLGRHTLVPKTYTITNDAGPDGDPITIFRVAPSSLGSNVADQSGSQVVSGSPLNLTIDESFIIFGPTKDAIWQGTISGGTLPYTVHMNWGDDTSNTYTLNTSGSQHFAHHYRSMHPYTITLLVKDAAGRSITQEYAAVTPYVPPIPSFTAPTIKPWEGSTPFGLYGMYLLLLAILGILWVRAHPFAYAKVPARHVSTKHKSKNS